jgi:large subunit ribosomal protein L23
MNILIKKPLISEKSMKLAKEGFYTFIVGKMARKLDIKKSIEEKFEVKVLDIRTINVKDLEKSQRRVRSTYIVKGFKKVIVKLKKGQKIGLFETEAAKVETAEDGEVEVKEKKSLLKGTKVKIEKKGKKK